MALAKQFYVTAWYAKHSHLAASSRSTEPRSLDRMQLHGCKLFCVCVSPSLWNTKHDTSNSAQISNSLVYVRPAVVERR
jgi:hypothetical protein